MNADPARCAAAGDGRRCPNQPIEGCRTHRNHSQLRGARASVDEGCACHERIHGSGALHSEIKWSAIGRFNTCLQKRTRHRSRERLRAGATSLLLLRVVLQITSRLFTTCRSRAKHGAGMSAPFLIYTFHGLRGKAARTRGRCVK